MFLKLRNVNETILLSVDISNLLDSSRNVLKIAVRGSIKELSRSTGLREVERSVNSCAMHE